jgi:hypothetical protein
MKFSINQMAKREVNDYKNNINGFRVSRKQAFKNAKRDKKMTFGNEFNDFLNLFN